jgi:ribulose-phosphate 3-epimerase
LHRTVHLIQRLGARAGVAINPATPVSALEDIAADLNYVLVMSVNPGFGGQTFIRRSESKVRAVRELLDKQASRAVVAIDGGIDLSNAAAVVAAGVEILVAGTSIFGQADPARALHELRAAAGGPA